MTNQIIYSGSKNGEFQVYRNGRILSPSLSQSLFNHSPDGFAWGYGGSGPSQLALALLLDVTGDGALSLRYHQQFKWEVIARLPIDSSFSLSEQEIRDWIYAHRSGILPTELEEN